MCPVLHSHTGLAASALDGTDLDGRPLATFQAREPPREVEAWEGKEKKMKSSEWKKNGGRGGEMNEKKRISERRERG